MHLNAQRKLRFGTILMLVSAISHAQAPGIQWQNTISGGSSDYLKSVKQTTDGGYILGGYSNSGISGDKTEPTLGYHDYWVVKLDAAGSIQWQNTIGGSGFDYLESVQETTDGGFILAGYSNSGISGDKTELCQGGDDYWVIKLDASGSIQWQNNIGGSNYDYLYSIQQTTDGGYVLGGSSNSGISGDKTESTRGNFDIWVVKLNAAGNVLWQNDIGGSNEDYLFSIQQTTDDGYILGGHSISGISGDKTEACQGLEDYWVLKLDAAGNIQWQNTIGGNNSDLLNSIQQTTDGGYVLGGYSSSSISGDKTEPLQGSADLWVVKLDATGNIQWQNDIGGSSTDRLISIQQTTDGGYILGGFSNSGISGDKTEACQGNYDYWVVKLDATGSIHWQSDIGGSDEDRLYSIHQTADGGYIMGGYSVSPISGDKTEPPLGYHDYWVVKLEGACAPTSELCNGLDDNCNGVADDGVIETISISAAGATTFCSGGSVGLTAVHTGVTLQWKKNGVIIPGATGVTYTATKTGDYTCQTTSACGTATSTVIPVLVNKTPSASISAGGPTTFCAGGSVTLTETPVGGSSYQWYKGASVITGATSTTYVATTAGNYKCRVTKTATGCFKNSNTITVSVVCREGDILAESSFQLYPNPTSDFITIETDLPTVKTIHLTDALGQVLQTITTSKNTITIDLKTVSSGVYFIRMEDTVNVLTQKFIKQ